LRFLRDPYTNKPNINFYCYRAVGGSTANTEAVKVMKVAVS
jgi:HK97 family phage major capsid protein